MTDEESVSFGDVMKKIYHALRSHIGAERIYQVTLMEGMPHFHSWLVPRRKEDAERGMKFLARDDSCRDEQASALAAKLQESIKVLLSSQR